MNRIYRIILVLLLGWSSVCLAQQHSIERIEPMNWWVGMHQPEVMLMVHGRHINQARVKVDYPGVSVSRTKAGDSPNYLFVYLHIAAKTSPGKVKLQFLIRDGQSVTVNYPLLARRPGSANRQGFSARDAIYLITPDRFANGNPANDTMPGLVDGLNRKAPGGRHGGDIQGVIDHLDYIARMGFSQIWLNPVLENAMDSYSYHGYSTTDYYHVDPRFGSNGLYRQLSKQAKAKGMGLIMDVILNHIGSDHPWMKDMPEKDWIHHHGKFVATTHHRETLHDPHASRADQQAFSDGWFVPSMPDLNQRNPQLATYLIQNCIWWIEYANLSGLRLDTYSYSDPQFLLHFTQRIMEEYPHFSMVGEEWSVLPPIVAYWQKDSPRKANYPSQLPSLMDFPLQHALIKALNSKKPDWTGVWQTLSQDFLYGHPNKLVIFADNHDTNRGFTLLHKNIAHMKMALAFVATSRGVPQFFYGDELLMDNGAVKNDGIIRSDFPGGWKGDKVNAFVGTGLTPAQKQMQQYVRKLFQWRKTSPAVTQGKLVQFVPDKGVYVYFRISKQQTVMVILNSGKKRTLAMQRFAEVAGRFHGGHNVLTGQHYDLSKTVEVPGNQALIIELTKEHE